MMLMTCKTLMKQHPSATNKSCKISYISLSNSPRTKRLLILTSEHLTFFIDLIFLKGNQFFVILVRNSIYETDHVELKMNSFCHYLQKLCFAQSEMRHYEDFGLVVAEREIK
jgi:hypothetical protein